MNWYRKAVWACHGANGWKSIVCTGKERYNKGRINSVLPCGVLRVCVEASGDNIWYKYAAGGKVINMTSFGQSAPMEKLYDYYGFTPQNIADTAKKLLDKE